MAVRRVANRVAEGGHDIPKDVIFRRYWAGLDNLFNIFEPIVDAWSLYDNMNDAKAIVKGGEIIDSDKLSKIKKLCQNRKK